MTGHPREILVKEPFRRTLPAENLTNYGQDFATGGYLAAYPEAKDPLRYELLTQADFMREFDVNSHRINSLKYYPNMFSWGNDEKGEKKLFQKIKSRVAVGWQERIWVKRMSALTGNNISLRISDSESGTKEQENLSLFREGWETKDMETALYQAIGADGMTGDCALAFYMDGGKLYWREFSFDKGDILYPHYDPRTGKLALLGRRYHTVDSRDRTVAEYLDVWDSSNYARYRLDQLAESHRPLRNGTVPAVRKQQGLRAAHPLLVRGADGGQNEPRRHADADNGQRPLIEDRVPRAG